MVRKGSLRRIHVFAIALALAAASSGSARAADEPMPVTVAPAAELFTHISGSAPATALPLQRTEVAARLATPVRRFDVEVGDRVEAGTRLATLDCTDAEDTRDTAAARLDEARARAELARLRLERIKRLHAQDAASADELDQARAERDASAATASARRADLAQTRRDVERCTVRAPGDAVITARHADAGDFVQPGTPLLTLVSELDLEARADVAGRDVRALLDAAEAVFRADGQRHGLGAARRTGVIEPATGTEEVRLRFAGTPPRPGAAGRVHWRSARRAVPPDLLVRRDGRLGVFAVHDGRARFHAIAGAVEGRPAITDLPADVRLIVEGRHAATDGTPVKIIE